MKMAVTKYIKFLNKKIDKKLHQFAKNVFEFNRYNTDMFQESDEKLIEIYVKVLYDIINGKIDIDKIKNKEESSKNAYIRYHIKKEKEAMTEIYDAYEGDSDNVLYVYIYRNLVKYISILQNLDNMEATDEIIRKNLEDSKKILHELDKPNIILKSMNHILNEEASCLEIPVTDFMKELENSDLKIRDKYKLFSIYMLKLRHDCNDIESGEVEVTDEKLKSIYKEVQDIFKKYNITTDNKYFNEDVYRALLVDLGFTNKFVDEIICFLDKQIEKENKIVDSKIESGIDRYSKREEEKEILRNKLSEFMDLRTMTLKRFLNRKEINSCILMLKKLKYDEDSIKKIISSNDSEVYKQNDITKCEYILDKAKYYSPSYGFEREYKDLLEYYNGYIESKDEEEKSLFYSYLKETLAVVISLLNTIRIYDYEFSIDMTEEIRHIIYEYKSE